MSVETPDNPKDRLSATSGGSVVLSSPPLYSVLQVRNGRFVWVPPGEQDAATLAGLIAGCRITQDVFRSVEAAAR